MADEIPMAEQLNRIEGRIDSLEQRVSVVQADVAVLQSDVSVLKNDVHVLKEDVSVLKGDVSVLKSDVSDLKGELREFRHAGKIQFENVDKGFKQVAEQYVSLGERMDRRFDAMERRQATDMAFIKQVLADHEGRIRGLEDAPGRPS